MRLLLLGPILQYSSGCRLKMLNVSGDDLCSGFEAQNWRKDRCKKCFRLKEQHRSTSGNNHTSSTTGNNHNNSSASASGSGNNGGKIRKFISPVSSANGASSAMTSSFPAAETSKSVAGISKSVAETSKSVAEISESAAETSKSAAETSKSAFSPLTSSTTATSSSWRQRVYGRGNPTAEKEAEKINAVPAKTISPSSAESPSSSEKNENLKKSKELSKNDNKILVAGNGPGRTSDSKLSPKSAADQLEVGSGSGSSESPSPAPPQRRTKIVLLKTEVSVDGGSPTSDEISVQTSVKPDSPAAAQSPKTSSVCRSSSPGARSYRSDDASSIAEYASVKSGPSSSMDRTMSFESVASTLMDDRLSMITAGSGGTHSERSTPTESLDETRAFVRSIRAQLEAMETKCAKLEEENMNLRITTPSSTSAPSASKENEFLVKELKESLRVTETSLQDYHQENAMLKREMHEMQEIMSKKLFRKESDKNDGSSLREKLTAAEQLCEELMDENENLKNELRNLQQELEEMRDQYREEEIDEFRDLQRELEQTAKNCRILQFKLRKSERRNDQTEADRQHLQEKIKEILTNSGAPLDSIQDSPRLRELESELRIAKEVSVRLHNELEAMDEKRCKLEDENFFLREKVREYETREKLNDIGRQRTDQKKLINLVRNISNGQDKITSSVFDQTTETQLLRDMHGALEREADLRDQLKFAENDIQIARKTLVDLETENECLMRQLAKFTNKISTTGQIGQSQSTNGGHDNGGNDAGNGNRRGSAKPPLKRSYSEGHTQIELELAEHEAQVLKAKLEKMEKDNECMISRISLLEKEASRCGGRTNFTDDELRSAVPDTYYKQKIRMLEEEIEEWKLKFETMQKIEADQDSAAALARLSSSSATNSNNKLMNSRNNASSSLYQHSATDFSTSRDDRVLKCKLEATEREANVLRQRVVSLEIENERLITENKRYLSLKKSKTSNSNNDDRLIERSSQSEQDEIKTKDRIEQMEKDIYRFINRIAELEKEKEMLSKELERRRKLESIKKETFADSLASKFFNPQTATISELREKVNELMKENVLSKANLKTEQQKAVDFETQVSEYKQIISMSDNQKLITMASKVEVLNNQLKETQNRYESMHRKLLPSQNGNNNGSSARYEDVLKERIEMLERNLAEEKAKTKNVSQVTNLKDIPINVEPEEETIKLAQCNLVLSTVENQVDRIYKQVEQLEAQQKASPKSSPSLPKTTRNTIQQRSLEIPAGGEKEQLLKDISSMKSELEALRVKLKDRKARPEGASVAVPISVLAESLPPIDGAGDNRSSIIKDVDSGFQMLQNKCKQQESLIKEMKEQLEVSKQERVNAYRECETATARLLQTEERWNKELEKLKESYENQVKDLKYYLQEAERVKEEKSTALLERSTLLNEKTKRLGESEIKIQKLENDLKAKHRDLQEKLDQEKKKAKEFETKYQKLETLYENDRQKLSQEKERFKSELSEIKKRYEETQTDFEKLKSTYDRKEQNLLKEKSDLETKIKQLKAETKEIEARALQKATETSCAENQKLLATISQLKKNHEKEAEEWKTEKSTLKNDLEHRIKEAEKMNEEMERTKRELKLMTSRVMDQKQQLEETRKVRDEAKEELTRWQQNWARERAELSHKMRQEEKVQQAEQQALQLKYESRIKIMEDSNKRAQTQLTQTRRERDQFRENISLLEKKLAELSQKYENDERELRQRLVELEKQCEKVEDLQMQLEKEKVENQTLSKTYKTDKKLWEIEKEQFTKKISELEKRTIAKRMDPISAPPTTEENTREENEKSKLVEESLQLATQLRKQADETKKLYDEEVANLRKQIEKSRQEWAKEKSEFLRKTKELQESLKVVEIDRRNALSKQDQNELEKNQLQSERDNLVERLQDTEIHQLANKYKLDKIAEQLTEIQLKFQSESVDKQEALLTVRKALEQLISVREDMSKTKELGKNVDIDDPKLKSLLGGSIRKFSNDSYDSNERHSADRVLNERLKPPSGAESDTMSVKSAPLLDKSDPIGSVHDHSQSISIIGSRSYMAKSYQAAKSLSVSSDTGADGSTFRFIRLRSPSPSPRKITNYPDPPPSMIFSTSRVVEYDSEGRRHWTRNSMVKRSISLDPNASGGSAMSDIGANGYATAVQLSIGQTQMIGKEKAEEATKDDSNLSLSKTSSAVATSTTNLSAGSRSPAYRRRMADIFATIRKSTSRERRKALFRDRKANSVESPETKFVGEGGEAQLPPLAKSQKSYDEPAKLSKGLSGSRILEKIRGRSSSRNKQTAEPKDDVGSAPGSSGSSAGANTRATVKKSPPRAQALPTSSQASTAATEFGSKNRTTSEENVLPKKGILSSTSSNFSSVSYSPSAFRRLSTSYSNVRMLSSRYLHRS